ncbi:MAG: ABC-type transport auxiliary lipoprotein family protein [Pseudomonadota bacterium]
MKRIGTSLLALLLVSCASAPVEPQYYLLRSDTQTVSRPLQPSADLAIGEVTIAPYIDQQGLVLQTQDGQIRAARYHRWAEPIPAAIISFLTLEVSAELGIDILPARISSADVVFGVRIDQMHGTAEGEAVLVAYWWITRGGELKASYQFAQAAPLSEDGYAALALAERKLLKQLASRIAASLHSSADIASG